jgi:hypothetical protein
MSKRRREEVSQLEPVAEPLPDQQEQKQLPQSDVAPESAATLTHAPAEANSANYSGNSPEEPALADSPDHLVSRTLARAKARAEESAYSVNLGFVPSKTRKAQTRRCPTVNFVNL